MNFTFIHVRDPKNIGDRVCCPADYFPEYKDCPRLDILDPIPNDGSTLIFGGGGLLHHGPWMERLEAVSRDQSRFRIIWGAGLNAHGRVKQIFPQWLDDFDLVGLRDFRSPYDYVPCPSVFAIPYNPDLPTAEVGIYQHHLVPVPQDEIQQVFGEAPSVLDNSTADLSTVLAFIARHHWIVTNSYHGAYWASLMGRKVSLYKPFSNRFFGWKEQIPIWPEGGSTPAAAGHCAALNFKFHAKVKALLQMPR